MTDRIICGECMVSDDHDELHYMDDWPHRPGDNCISGEHCTGCNPNNDSYAAMKEEEPSEYMQEIVASIRLKVLAEMPCYAAVAELGGGWTANVPPPRCYDDKFMAEFACPPCSARAEKETKA